MPCFYCGKPISFVRRLADPDFCSEDHRAKYLELTRMALQRLVETRDQLETAAPKRKRQRSGATAGQPVPPLPVELLPEHVRPVTVVGQLSISAGFVQLHLPLQMPAIHLPVLRASCTAKEPVVVATPGPVQPLETPPTLAFPQSGFLSITALSGPDWSHFGSAPSPRSPLLPLLPLLKPSEVQATGADGCTPVTHEAFPLSSASRLPPRRLAVPGGASLSPITTVLPLRGPAPHSAPPAAPAAGASVRIPAARAILPSEIPAPHKPGGLAMGLAVCCQSLAAPPPVEAREALLAAPAPAPFLPPVPRVCHAVTVRFGATLAVGPPLPGRLAPPLQRPPLTVLDSGRGILSITPEIKSPQSPIWRLQPVQLDFPSLTFPPALSDWFPICAPQSRAQAEYAVAAPPETWRLPVPSVVSTGISSGPVHLRPARPIPVELPAGQLRAEPRMAQAAPSPEFPITRQFYIGWGATSLRRALHSAEPLTLGVGQGREGLLSPRESPPPGFRIAAWAFTHAPGVAPVAATPVGSLLAAHPPAPADSASRSARLVERPLGPTAAPAFPSWRAELIEERLPTAATEPPEAGYASLPPLPPLSGKAALRWQPAAEIPNPENRWPTRPACLMLNAPHLRSLPTPCSAAVPSPCAGIPDLRNLPALEFAGPARLPESRRPAAPVFSPGGVVATSPAHAPALEGRFAASPPPVGWQTPGAAPVSFQAVRPSMSRVDWDPAFHWQRLLVTPAGGSVSPGLASVAMSQTPVAWPPVAGIGALGTFRCAAPSQFSAPPALDPAAARSPWPGASVAEAPPRALALPSVMLALPGVLLPVLAPTSEDGQALDAPKAPRQPSQLPPMPPRGALPAGPGVPECSPDLFWPYAAPVGPAARDQTPALRDPAELAPLRPSMLLEARPMAPIPHRFERLPLETEFVPVVRVARFWKRISRRAVFAFAAPALVLLLGVLLWNPVRETARQRAAVTIGDDFSAGMGRWTSGAADWSRDPAGFAVVGSLALLGPSLRLTDYRLDFQGQIERESLTWVFRARDLKNYYAMKIAVLKPGPLPALALIRYRVLEGQPALRVEVPLRIMLHNESTFRVQMRVTGSDFTTFVNQQQVDFWTDDRLASGGIGFFCEKGSRARLYWVRIAHQDDLVGKLCSLFARNDLSENGSWK